jgi:glycosyltransferase involved in cell wall biosynthesis
MVSIIIPAYKDPFLQKTIDSLLTNAQGEIEIIAILDGYEPETPIKKDNRVYVIKFKSNQGMRHAINAGLKKASGEFIMKADAHCAFCPGFDLILSKNCKPSWLTVPRRYSLDTESWTRKRSTSGIDYHYMTYPVHGPYGTNLTISTWQAKKYSGEGSRLMVDDTMIFQGSSWLANRKYFMKHVGHLDGHDSKYGQFGGEQIEIGLKYWLGGGKVKIVKDAWYAHLNKRRYHYRAGIFSREYKRGGNFARGQTWCAKHWMNNQEPGMKHPFSWLIEKFWPVPGWPEDRTKWSFPG